MSNITKVCAVIGIDLGKSNFYVYGTNKQGRKILSKEMDREELSIFINNHPSCLIGMEACGGAHNLAREFVKLGHEVKLMPAKYVKIYVKSQKNDRADAEAICEAVTRPNMRFVRVKSIEEQDMAQLHRARERLVKARTALINETHGFLLENGLTFVKGVRKFINNVIELLDKNTKKISAKMRALILENLEEFRELEKKISAKDITIKELHKSNALSKRLESIPGVGVLTATAVVSKIGNGSQFKKGRQLSAFLGLVPRQYSTGGKTVLGRISKMGDPYIRKLLVQGAMCVIRFVGMKTDKVSLWLKDIIERKGKCKAALALANKNARIIWKLLSKGDTYIDNYGVDLNEKVAVTTNA